MHKLREHIFRMRDHLMMSRHDFEDEAYEDSPEYEHGETVGDIWAGNYPQLRCRTRMSIACDDVSDSIWAAVCEEGVTPLSDERLVFTMLRKLNELDKFIGGILEHPSMFTTPPSSPDRRT